MDRNDILQIHVENMQKGSDEMKMVLRNLEDFFSQETSQGNPPSKSLISLLL